MWRIFLDESKKAGKKKRKSLFPLVNLTEVVVIMRRTDNTWEHVERITIADSDTRKCRHTNFLSQTLPKHMQYEIQPIQTRPYTPALPYPGLPHNSYTSKLQDKMTCSILYGHLYTHTHTHVDTLTHTDTGFSFFPFSSCTGAWTGQSSLFKRGCFEFQRGAHERAAEYKGVPKDTLQRSMWGQFSPDGKPGSKAWPP